MSAHRRIVPTILSSPFNLTFFTIPQGLGLLSDGTVEMRQPDDLMGAHVGDTAQKTSALVANCRGKTLVIDEAYVLNQNAYGKEALDTLVSKVLP